MFGFKRKIKPVVMPIVGIPVAPCDLCPLDMDSIEKIYFWLNRKKWIDKIQATVEYESKNFSGKQEFVANSFAELLVKLQPYVDAFEKKNNIKHL